MQESILFVDDEENILKALQRLFLNRDLEILVARNADEALELLRHNEIAVVVTDNQMPGMNGIGLLEVISRRYPDTLRMLMTAHVDLATALEAINKGEAFRFIVKPWQDDDLVVTVQHGLERYRLIKSMKREDENVFRSIGQTIELKDPYTKGHCDRVAEYALLVGRALQLPAPHLKDIEFGSWLHDCGKIGVPESILSFNGPVGPLDFEIIRKHPEWGAEVARKAGMREAIINIILYHHERIDGKGYPSGLAGSEIPLEARIVAIADIFDALTSDRPYRKAYERREALSILDEMKGCALDPDLVDLFAKVVQRAEVKEQGNTYGGS